MLRAWKCRVTSGIRHNKSICMGSLLHADDIVLIQENEDDLQRAISVSYTHLDVYKRQLSTCHQCIR